MPKVMTVFGTRPEAIKMAPVIAELRRRRREFQTQVVVTGQHRELLDQVLSLFGITPDVDLQIMKHGQTLGDVTVRVIEGLEPTIARLQPDVVLVHGDTTTTFAASLAASYQKIPVGHIEAGLRTENRFNPFPEELNRRLTAVLSSYHFAPTQTGADNLLREGIAEDDIFVTGNTVIDALKSVVSADYSFVSQELVELSSRSPLILLTTHRRENWGEPMSRVFAAMRQVAGCHPEAVVLFPVHKNPQIRLLAEEMLGDLTNVHLIAPPAYADFVNLMARCYLIVTDSGGLQEEAPALGKPVLVLRQTTERPEAVASGTAALVGTNPQFIVSKIEELLSNQGAYQAMAQAKNPYGDGLAARRVVQGLAYKLGLSSERPKAYLG